MGTRNLIMVKLNGKRRVAQYCQWDGYPTGQGKEIASFLQRANLDTFAKKVEALTFATDKEIKDTWTKAGADPESDLVSFAIAEKHTAMYPEFSRDTGAKVLGLIQRGKVKKVQNSVDFLKDSLFCEWAYEIDLDKKCVNVYRGFQATGKMETKTRSDGSTYQAEKYAPCKIAKRIAFKDFTAKRMELLEKEISGSDDE